MNNNEQKDDLLKESDQPNIVEQEDLVFSSLEKKNIKQRAKEIKKEFKANAAGSISDEELFNRIQSKLISNREQQLLIREYFKKKFFSELLLIALAAFLVTIAFDYLITATGRTGLFPAGLGAFARFFSIISFSNDEQMQGTFYFIFFFALNIPFFIFGYFKIGKKFSFTTLLYIGCQIGFDQMLRQIPYINPNDFFFIVNITLLDEIPNQWGNGIWMFLFALIGGTLIGLAYSILYKIGSSTGGADFITFYFSIKKSKPVGDINRNVNLFILGFIIILNTSVLNTALINDDILLQVIKNHTKVGDEHFAELFEKMFNYSVNNGAYLESNKWLPEFEAWFGLSDAIKPEDAFNEMNGVLKSSQETFDYLTLFSVKRGFGDDLPAKLEALAKLQFIFGPSLFASVILVITSGITTNYLYPKYKVRTYMISTKKPDEIYKSLIENGYLNDISSWDVTNRINNNYLHRTNVMVTMSVLDWDNMEKKLFLSDPELKITIFRTKSVKGLFKYEVKKNDERAIINQKVASNETEIEKIRQIAIVKSQKTKKKTIKKTKKPK